jgi:ATP-dependent transcriptional regulator
LASRLLAPLNGLPEVIAMESVIKSEMESELAPKLLVLIRPRNLEILSALATSPMSTRQLSKLLGLQESNVSARLQELVKFGFVRDEGWRRVNERNVKLYSLGVNGLSIEFLPQGYRLRLRRSFKKPTLETTFYYGDFESPTIGFEFIGRRRELESLAEHRSVLIWGIAGIGKTTLAAKFAESLGTPIFWHRVRETDSFIFVVNKLVVYLSKFGRVNLATLLEEGEKDTEVLEESAIQEVTQLKALAVFDDYHLCGDSELKRFIAKFVGRTKAIVISRSKPVELLGHGVFELELGGFSNYDARSFIESRLHRGVSEQDLKTISKRTENHPLALELLCQVAMRGGELPEGVVAASESFVSQLSLTLSQEELQLLSALSVFREAVPVEAVKWVVPMRLPIRRILHNLEGRGIVKRRGGLYGAHGLIREALYNRMGSPEQHSRAAAYYRRLGDIRSMLEALYHYAEAGDSPGVLDTIKSCWETATEQGLSEILGQLIDRLLRQPLSKEAEMWCLYAKANILSHGSTNLDESLSLLNRAMEISISIRDYEFYTRCKQLTGLILVSKGKVREAIRLLQETLEEAAKWRLPAGRQAGILSVISQAYMRGYYLNKILRIQEKILDLYKEAGNRVLVFATIGNMGIVNMLLGRFEEASAKLREALDGLEMLGDISDMGTAMFNLAIVLRDSGRVEEALWMLKKSVKHLRLAHKHSTLLSALSESALLNCELGNLEQAAKLIGEAKRLSGRVEEVDSLGVYEFAQAVLALIQGEKSTAETHFDLALNHFKNSLYDRARALMIRGEIELKIGLKDAGRNHLTQARGLFSRISSQGYINKVDKLLSAKT